MTNESDDFAASGPSAGGARSARAAQRRWLPAGRRGPMPWIIAIIMFLTLLAGAAGLGLAHALIQMRAQLAGGYTVQVVAADAARRSDQVARVASYLRGEPAVRNVTVIPEETLAEQLEPWIGQHVQADELPIPALVDLTVRPGTKRAEIDRISGRIAAIAPSARMDAHGHYLAPVEHLMRTLMWLAAGLVVLMLMATGAVVTLAARSAHESHRGTIDIMHLLGATDLQIARLFQRRIALDALFGGVLGTLAAALALVLLGRNLMATGSELLVTVTLPWRAAMALLAVPIFGVLVAAVTARLTVKRALERSL